MPKHELWSSATSKAAQRASRVSWLTFHAEHPLSAVDFVALGFALRVDVDEISRNPIVTYRSLGTRRVFASGDASKVARLGWSSFPASRPT
jgi:hypothetical protein